jgi:homoserine dehydrogenase
LAQTYSLALLGFGNVGRALAGLLHRKTEELRTRYGIEWKITGVASRRLGWHANLDGYTATELAAGDLGTALSPWEAMSLADWLSRCRANVLFENTSMNPETGQPAIDYLRTALRSGIHVVTANKGPVVHGYQELRDLAAANGVRFLFEASVMGGAPIFSLFRGALPAANLRQFRGILNSTTNLMLTEMEQGLSFDRAVKKAQDLGIAETDPSADVDGWDAAVKVSALATVLMDTPLPPQRVDRQGIRDLSAEAVRAARLDKRPYKLVCQAMRTEAGGVAASVRPQQVPIDDPLASVSGASSIVTFELDTLHGLTLKEENPDAITTAYGPFADFISIATGR